jgi:hypothetical protein
LILKDRASFFSFFFEKPLYEVYLIRIKEQVGEKRSTVCTHRYADCLLKNTSTKEYLDLHLEIDSEGRLTTKLYDKRDDFNFPIVNFSFICSNIPATPAGVNSGDPEG